MLKVLVHLPLVDVVTKKPEINKSDELSKISGKCWGHLSSSFKEIQDIEYKLEGSDTIRDT